MFGLFRNRKKTEEESIEESVEEAIGDSVEGSKDGAVPVPAADGDLNPAQAPSLTAGEELPESSLADFDAEFSGADLSQGAGSPEASAAIVEGSDNSALSLQDQSAELEEIYEPLPQLSPLPALAEGAVLFYENGSNEESSVRVLSLESTRPGLNIYRAALSPPKGAEDDPAANNSAAPTDDGGAESGSEGNVVRLREAGGALAERLAREATARLGKNSPMLPKVLGFFEHEGKSYLLEDLPGAEPTFEKLFSPDAELSEIVHTLAQVAAAMAQLHSDGWACLGLRPSSIVLGKPVQITDFTFIAPLGEESPPLSLAGYSAPELATGAATDVRMDVYSIGALLYSATSGSAIPETGPDLEFWKPPSPLPGVPQILHRCLGPQETRYNSVQELHQDLVQLKNRLKPAVYYNIATASTIGLELSRNTNQDACCHLSGSLQSESGSLPWVALCVADGMGGMAAGEVASEVAVQTVLKEAATSFVEGGTLTPAEQAEHTQRWARAANESVVSALEERGARGGCTFVCASAVEQNLAIAHIGDCRIYHIRDKNIQKLTRDHSFVMALVQQGEITEDEIRTHPDRNKVSRSMGDRHPMPDYFVDTLETVTGQATLELQAGDTVLLCSDGLWELVVESEMLEAIARHSPNLHASAQEMLEIVLERGAPDNATVALLQLEAGISGP